jgi:D-arabinose 1-dehydrogenase-like Zn-dependent alcohol dehydrogenase
MVYVGMRIHDPIGRTWEFVRRLGSGQFGHVYEVVGVGGHGGAMAMKVAKYMVRDTTTVQKNNKKKYDN